MIIGVDHAMVPARRKKRLRSSTSRLILESLIK